MHLKSKFETKDLGKTWFFLGRELKHCVDGILIHQSNYTQKCRDPLIWISEAIMHTNGHPHSRCYTRPIPLKEDGEEVVELQVSYLSAIGALLYLVQCSKLDISFAVNLLARYSFALTRRHWDGIKDIFCYLKGTLDMGLFYPYASQNNVNSHEPQNDVFLAGYVDVCYISDPYKACSQTGYFFTTRKMMISWRSMK